jgi:pimeloyl-ACP methyl ester carboxylesterase
VLTILALPYLLICAGCASCQRQLIYFPPVFDGTTADQLGASANLQRWNGPSGGPVGWKRPAPVQPAKGSVLLFHGNACAAVQCSHYADDIQSAANLAVHFAEFPGYGDHPGSPTERTLEEAADKALQALAGNGPVYVVGESLGTGVACWLAGQHPDKIAGVILLAPYNSLTDVAQAHMPLLPVHLMLVDRFPAEKYLRNFTGPVAMLVGGQDPVVPEKFGRRLYDSYGGPKRLWEFPEDDHGTVMLQPPEIWKQIFEFLRASAKPPGRN